MLLKSLLIAMMFAVCIDRSFEAPKIINCNTPKECISKVNSNEMYEGVVPVIVTYQDMNIKAEEAILNFFKTQPFPKILKVNVKRGQNIQTSNYLSRNQRTKIGYPYVTALNDNMLIRDMVPGYKEKDLIDFLEKAKNPQRKDIIHTHRGFTIDMENIIKNDENKNKTKGKGKGQVVETWESRDSEAETLESQQPEAETLESQKPEAEILKSKKPEEEDVLLIDALGTSRVINWQSSLYYQTDLFAALNPQDKSVTSQSRSTPEQTEPEQKKARIK